MRTNAHWLSRNTGTPTRQLKHSMSGESTTTDQFDVGGCVNVAKRVCLREPNTAIATPVAVSEPRMACGAHDTGASVLAALKVACDDVATYVDSIERLQSDLANAKAELAAARKEAHEEGMRATEELAKAKAEVVAVRKEAHEEGMRALNDSPVAADIVPKLMAIRKTMNDLVECEFGRHISTVSHSNDPLTKSWVYETTCHQIALLTFIKDKLDLNNKKVDNLDHGVDFSMVLFCKDFAKAYPACRYNEQPAFGSELRKLMEMLRVATKDQVPLWEQTTLKQMFTTASGEKRRDRAYIFYPERLKAATRSVLIRLYAKLCETWTEFAEI